VRDPKQTTGGAVEPHRVPFRCWITRSVGAELEVQLGPGVEEAKKICSQKAVLTLAIGLVAYRIPRPRALLAAGFLMAATGLGSTGIEGFWPLLVIALAGTLNPSGGDVGVFLSLEHAVLAQRLRHYAIPSHATVFCSGSLDRKCGRDISARLAGAGRWTTIL
jgi:hypothetical protein